MDGMEQSGRSADGRFLPGCSGNPAGKRPGTRNRATLFAEALGNGEIERLIRVLVEKGLAGDGVAARFCVGRMAAAPRGRAVRLDLPAPVRPEDALHAFGEIVAAMAAGEITPDEALTVIRVLEGRRLALRAWERHPASPYYRAPAGGPSTLAAGESEAEPSENDGDEESDDDDDEEEGEAAATEAPSGGLFDLARLPRLLAILEAEHKRRAALRAGSERRAASRDSSA